MGKGVKNEGVHNFQSKCHCVQQVNLLQCYIIVGVFFSLSKLMFTPSRNTKENAAAGSKDWRSSGECRDKILMVSFFLNPYPTCIHPSIRVKWSHEKCLGYSVFILFSSTCPRRIFTMEKWKTPWVEFPPTPLMQMTTNCFDSIIQSLSNELSQIWCAGSNEKSHEFA